MALKKMEARHVQALNKWEDRRQALIEKRKMHLLQVCSSHKCFHYAGMHAHVHVRTCVLVVRAACVRVCVCVCVRVCVHVCVCAPTRAGGLIFVLVCSLLDCV